MSDTIMVAPQDITFVEEPTAELGQQLTQTIRAGLNSVRKAVLTMYKTKAWEPMGYRSFKAWAQAEFEMSWQHVYNLKAAAEMDVQLGDLLYSPDGDAYEISVNAAKQLRKLNTKEARASAYQLALEQATSQGEHQPTAKIVEQAVDQMQAKEYVQASKFMVVRQMVAAGDEGITAGTGRAIIKEMLRVDDERAHAFIQRLMAEYGLKNPKLVYPLAFRYWKEMKNGKLSKVLDEVDKAGTLDGIPLSQAHDKDLARANEKARQEHIDEAKEQARQLALQKHKEDPENNLLPPEPVASTLWKRDAQKNLAALERDLDESDVVQLFELLARKFGYVQIDSQVDITFAQAYAMPVPDDLDGEQVPVEMMIRAKMVNDSPEGDA